MAPKTGGFSSFTSHFEFYETPILFGRGCHIGLDGANMNVPITYSPKISESTSPSRPKMEAKTFSTETISRIGSQLSDNVADLAGQSILSR